MGLMNQRQRQCQDLLLELAEGNVYLVERVLANIRAEKLPSVHFNEVVRRILILKRLVNSGKVKL